VRDDTIVLSTQVLQEFYNITTRKLKPPLSRREAAQQVRHLSAFEVVGATSGTIVAATDLAEKHQMHWWDALILEAALRANADVLYSEDGQHGQRFGQLTVTNPFV
jgi:predicted nucleic acid-binding protein